MYCVVVFKWCISSCTKIFTWKFLFDNGESKYKCFLDWTQDNAIYVKSCFVMLVGPNAKWSRVKPCVRWIVHVVANWMGNWILAIMWKWLLPICICIIFLFYWCPFLINCKELFINARVFYLCIYSNLWIITRRKMAFSNQLVFDYISSSTLLITR